ncbi:HtaA domain-containing protein [Streptomyces sp. NPDC048172]|uniref:HtaA domain-containing protein n=1 Tax=Streptomyces sp. NPDC048172 TaxID=3365505 RepID=UPI00371F28B6
MPYARRARARMPLPTALAVVVPAALLPLALPAGPAHAAERTVSGGRLDWGIKSSFQSYVTGPVAQGRWTLSGGAATAGESQFRFHSAKGGYDPDTGSLDAGFSGGVHFTGHRRNGTNALDLTISRPTVRISGKGSGTLYADIRSKAKSTGKFSNTAQVPLASLNLSGVNMRGGSGPITLTGVPATLTAEGAKSFAGYYKAGTRLDPVSLSADVQRPAAPGKKKEKEKSKEESKEKPGKESRGGRIEDAAVDWGVRRTFREYVTGPIAKGKWKLSDGAKDGGALFRFPRGTGQYDEREGTLEADFAGAVRFEGKHLGLTLSALSVTVKDGKGTLSADVTAKGRTEKARPLVTFAAKKADLKPEKGLVALSETPATLTAEGAKAFAGMYAKGAKMDPLSLAVALDDKAELPALPDLGSGSTSASGTSGDDKPEPKREKPARTENAAGSSAVPYVATGAGAAVLLAAGVTFAVVRKRRAASPSTTD